MEKTQHTSAYKRLTAALRKARADAGLTQAEVAEKLGLYASFVSKVESGERRLDVVEKVLQHDPADIDPMAQAVVAFVALLEAQGH